MQNAMPLPPMDGYDGAFGEIATAYRGARLIIFAGADFLATTGSLTEGAMIEMMLESGEACRRLDADARQAIRKLAANAQWAEALSLVRNRLGKQEFNRCIEELLDDESGTPSPILPALAALVAGLRAVITTAIDHAVERAFAGKWMSFTRVTGDITQRQGYILKLRGTLGDHSTWILGREDYEQALYDRRRLDVLAALLRTCTVLFLGYDFSDSDIQRVLERLRSTSDGQPPRHFAVPPESGLPSWQREQLEASGIHFIDCSPGAHNAVSHRILRGLAYSDRRTEETARFGGPYREAAIATTTLPCPFPGLGFFDEEHADFFFGREAEVSSALQALGDTDSGHKRWLFVDGPSGVGKSSLVRAGIIPRVRAGQIVGSFRNWRVAIMRPGAQPLTSLAHVIHKKLECHPGSSLQLDKLVSRLRDGADTTLASIVRQYLPHNHGLFLVIDQLEEAFTLAANDECQRFDTVLAAALEDRGCPLYLCSTVRSDFAANISQLPCLEAMLNRDASRFYLKPMSVPGLRAAIVKPVRKIGLHWEDHLVSRIIRDADRPDRSLPLVAHVLQALWWERSDRRLTFTAYERLGGVEGALTRSADHILGQLGKEDKARARELLLCLVTLNRREMYTRQPVVREQAVAAAGGGRTGEQILLHLSGGRSHETPVGNLGRHPRLVAVTRHRDGDRVDLVHEALLSHWATLRLWLDHSRKELLVHEDLRARLETWKRAGSSPRGLPEGGELQYLLGATRVSEEESQFLQAASQRNRTRWLLARALVGALVCGMLAVGWLATFAFHQRDEAATKAAEAHRETIRAQKAEEQVKEQLSAARAERLRAEKARERAEDAEGRLSGQLVVVQRERQRADEAKEHLLRKRRQLEAANTTLEDTNKELAITLDRAERATREANRNAEKAQAAEKRATNIATRLQARLDKEQKNAAQLRRRLQGSELFDSLDVAKNREDAEIARKKEIHHDHE